MLSDLIQKKKNKNQFRTYGKDLLYLISANIFNNVVTFTTAILLAKLIGPDKFGIFSISLAVLTTASVIIDFGLSISVVKKYNDRETPSEKELVLQSAVLLKTCGTILLLLLIFPLAPLLNTVLFGEQDLDRAMYVALLSAAAFGWWGLLRALNQATQSYTSYAIATVQYGALRLVCAALLFLSGERNPLSYILGLYLVAPMAVAAWSLVRRGIQYFRQREAAQTRPFSKVLAMAVSLIGYGKWPFLSSVLFPLTTTLPLFMLGHLSDLEGAGVFGVAMFFSNVLSPLRDGLRVFALPKVSSIQSPGEAKRFVVELGRRWYLGLVFAVVVTGASLIALEVIYGGSYPNAHYVVLMIVPTQVITMYTGLMGTTVHFLGRPQIHTYVDIGRLLLCFVLSYWLVPGFGAIGAAIASSITILSGEVIICILVKRMIDREVNRGL